jgi:hypothetical protein
MISYLTLMMMPSPMAVAIFPYNAGSEKQSGNQGDDYYWLFHGLGFKSL